jgi:signal transduction histidine kinase/FixJ family two-component response regulator/HPt (histidine-containing phosphotransfer) domain-containing protein
MELRKFHDRQRFRPQWWIYASAALLILVLTAADIAVVLNLRENSLRSAERTLENSSRTLAEEADRAFQSVDLVLSNLIEKIEAAGVVDSDSYDRLMSTNAVYLLLREQLNGLPQLDAITLIRADGKLINFSRYWPIPEVDISDRDYFQALKSDPTRKSFIGAPVQNRGDGSWTIYLARRVNGPDGRFAGLVLGAMTMKYFEDFYHSVRPGESSAISMIRDDGVLLTRYPASSAIGQSFPETGGQRALRGGAQGTIREPSPIDGSIRIKAAAQVPNYPLVILVTMGIDEALGNWPSIAITLSVITAGCSIAVAFAAATIGRWSRHQQVLAQVKEEQAAAENARIAAEAELLRERERHADAANRAKSSFLAMMSHEIRTPMNAVLALAGTLLDEPLPPEQRRIVTTIRDSGDDLLRILNDILDYSKMEAGRIALESLAFAPATLCQNVTAIMAARAAAKGLFLREEVGPDLPPLLLGDAGRIKQILMNLVSNALKFTTAGGVTITTRCCARDDNQATLEWRVSDTGIGIPAEKLENLFKEFSQADNSIARRFGGTGLGLAISKRLVDQMGGTITIDSAEGKGTTFSLRLSLPITTARQPEAGAEHANGEQKLVEALTQLGRPARILVAEDNPTNQFVMAQLLKSFDIRVHVVNDGIEAIEAAAAIAPDLIFMDMQMPEMDGLEATRVLRKRRGRLATLPIIALTANAFAESAAACREAGMNDFIVKPIKKERLIGAILNALLGAEKKAPPGQASISCASVFPPLDPKAWAELVADLGQDGAREMVAIFIVETRARLARLQTGCSDAADFEREVHTLKGAARTAGAAELGDLAATLEARLSQSQDRDCPELPHLRAAFDAYVAAVGTRMRPAVAPAA